MFQVTTLTHSPAFSFQIQCIGQATYPEATAGGRLASHPDPRCFARPTRAARVNHQKWDILGRIDSRRVSSHPKRVRAPRRRVGWKVKSASRTAVEHASEPRHVDQASPLPIEVVPADPPRVDDPTAAAAQAGLAAAGHLDLRIPVRVEASTAPLSAGEAAVQARNPGPRTGTGQASRPDQDGDEPTQELPAIQTPTSPPGRARP
jgi:hypothetical protein